MYSGFVSGDDEGAGGAGGGAGGHVQRVCVDGAGARGGLGEGAEGAGEALEPRSHFEPPTFIGKNYYIFERNIKLPCGES